MKSSKQVATITPTLAKDISFNDKVGEVDTALRSRAAVQKEIKTKWVRVVRVLSKYDVKAPGRRSDAGAAAGLVQDLVVYKPMPEIAPEFQQILDSGGSYQLSDLATRPNLLRLIDAKVSGFKKFVEDFVEAQAASRETPIKDEAKTKEARAELQAAVDEYLTALESFDDTVTSVASVKEYIGIVKDIADISAIAQGVKAKE
jgi:hypothetical protein